ncbi:MAG: cupin domain-containing protein [Planctomycetaceae bacterium]|nr:cupin domain-containing protein [Planctomycetaceae bacterium]
MSNYTTYEAGTWSDLGQHCFRHPPLEAPGKCFLSERVDSSGCEISLNRFEPGKGYPFLHRHQQQEEIYIVVSGSGEMLVDESIIPLQEGSVVRIAPAGVRSLRASADGPICFLCIQATEGTLTSRTIGDGSIVPGPVNWQN